MCRNYRIFLYHDLQSHPTDITFREGERGFSWIEKLTNLSFFCIREGFITSFFGQNNKFKCLFIDHHLYILVMMTIYLCLPYSNFCIKFNSKNLVSVSDPSHYWRGYISHLMTRCRLCFTRCSPEIGTFNLTSS